MLRAAIRMLPQLLLRPGAVPVLLRAAWRFRARDWYRRPPFLPMPHGDYMQWRLETAYGGPESLPRLDEVVRYLRWGERLRRARSRRPGEP